MRVIIAGSRTIDSYDVVVEAIIASGFTITQVVSGTARGVDRMGELWAAINNVAVARFPADWRNHGSAAGFTRNQLMAENADALIAVWDGKSRGTLHMINEARAKGLKVFVHA